MFADDVAGTIAIDTLGAAVPARDQAVFVERHDGIVHHAFDQQPKALLAFPQCRFVFPALGEIPGDLGKPEQRADLITNRRDDHVGPEARAILARAPSLLLETPFPRGDGELAVGSLPLIPIRYQHAREMHSNHFPGVVAMDVLGARIPGGYRTVRIEHVDGVVAHAFHQRAESRFVVAQALFVPASLGEITRHLRVARQAAVGSVKRRDDHIGPEARPILAHSPAFVLEASITSRDHQLCRRQAAFDGFGGIEHREMFADDLLGLVTLDGLGARIPADDVTHGIEHQQRVVAYRLDEDTEAEVVDPAHTRTQGLDWPGRLS